MDKFGDPMNKKGTHCSVHCLKCPQARDLKVDPAALTEGFYFYAWNWENKKKPKHFPSYKDYISRISDHKARYCKSMYNKVKTYKEEMKKDFEDVIRENQIEEININRMNRMDESVDDGDDDEFNEDDQSDTVSEAIDTDSDIVFVSESLLEEKEKIVISLNNILFCLNIDNLVLKEKDFEFLREVDEVSLRKNSNKLFDYLTTTSKKQLFNGKVLERLEMYKQQYSFLKKLHDCILILMEKNDMKICVGIGVIREEAEKKKVDYKKVNVRGFEEYHHPDCSLLVESYGTSYSYKCINFRKKIQNGKEKTIIIKDPVPSTLNDLYKEYLFKVQKLMEECLKISKQFDENSKLPFVMNLIHSMCKKSLCEKKNGFRHTSDDYSLAYLLVTYGGKRIISLLNGKKGVNVDLNNQLLSLPTVKSIRNRLPMFDGKLGLQNMDTQRVIEGISIEDRKNKFFHFSVDEAAMTFGLSYRNGMLYGFEEIINQKDIQNVFREKFGGDIDKSEKLIFDRLAKYVFVVNIYSHDGSVSSPLTFFFTTKANEYSTAKMLNPLIEGLHTKHGITIDSVWSDGFVRPTIEGKLANGVKFGFDSDHFGKNMRNNLCRKTILFEDFFFKFSEIAPQLLTIESFCEKLSTTKKKNPSKAVYFSDEQNVECFKMLISGWKELKEYDGENKDQIQFFGSMLENLNVVYSFFKSNVSLNKLTFEEAFKTAESAFRILENVANYNKKKREKSKVYGISFVLISQIKHTFKTIDFLAKKYFKHDPMFEMKVSLFTTNYTELTFSIWRAKFVRFGPMEVPLLFRMGVYTNQIIYSGSIPCNIPTPCRNYNISSGLNGYLSKMVLFENSKDQKKKNRETKKMIVGENKKDDIEMCLNLQMRFRRERIVMIRSIYGKGSTPGKYCEMVAAKTFCLWEDCDASPYVYIEALVSHLVTEHSVHKTNARKFANIMIQLQLDVLSNNKDIENIHDDQVRDPKSFSAAFKKESDEYVKNKKPPIPKEEAGIKTDHPLFNLFDKSLFLKKDLVIDGLKSIVSFLDTESGDVTDKELLMNNFSMRYLLDLLERQGWTTFISHSTPYSDICRDGFPLAVTYSMTIFAITLKQAIDGLLRELERLKEQGYKNICFLCHNKSFEIRILRESFKRLQKLHPTENYIFPQMFSFIDMMVIIRKSGFKTVKLDKLIDLLKIERTGEEHTASRDILNESKVLHYFLSNCYDGEVCDNLEKFVKGELDYNKSKLFTNKLGEESIDFVPHLNSKAVDIQLKKWKVRNEEKAKTLMGEENFNNMLSLNPTLFPKGKYTKFEAKKLVLIGVMKNSQNINSQDFSQCTNSQQTTTQDLSLQEEVISSSNIQSTNNENTCDSSGDEDVIPPKNHDSPIHVKLPEDDELDDDLINDLDELGIYSNNPKKRKNDQISFN